MNIGGLYNRLYSGVRPVLWTNSLPYKTKDSLSVFKFSFWIVTFSECMICGIYIILAMFSYFILLCYLLAYWH